MPAARPEVEILALIASISVVVVPFAMFRPSHEADSMSVQVSVPPAGFEILNICATGAAPPAVPEKLSDAGLRDMLGVEVVVDLVLRDVVVAVPSETTNVTGTVVD